MNQIGDSDRGSVAKVVWERRWERFALALAENGVEPRMRSFCKGWVLGFLKFARPKNFFQVTANDVGDYLQKLIMEGKQNWQVRQAVEAGG